MMLATLIAVAGLLMSPQRTHANTVPLYTFSGPDGGNPFGGLVQGSDGSFYGTTANGGANGNGTVFRITSVGALTTLHSFTYTDGSNPTGALVQGSDGNLYGTTYAGGTSGAGTVFKITLAGALTTLHSFHFSDGTGLWAGLVQGSDGSFYGTTYEGGGAFGGGTIFKITAGGTFTTLHMFPSSFINFDGSNPTGALVQGSDGNFYGTAYHGGTGGVGTVFKITAGGSFTLLHSFNNSDGQAPFAGLVQGSDGNFYGTTLAGGAYYGLPGHGDGEGTVFKMTSDGALTTLYSFNQSDGAGPRGNLVQGSDGDFYGTTYGGGPVHYTEFGPTQYGIVFKITSGGSLTMLYGFSGIDGESPQGGLVQGRDGNFYGTTVGGGAGGVGTVFMIDGPPAPTTVEQCKNGGWMTFTSPHPFKNQGDCIQFVNTGN